LKYFPKDGQIVDCGAWYGRFIRFLQQHGYSHLHALDFVDLVSAADRDKVTVHAVDFNIEPIPYPDNFLTARRPGVFPNILRIRITSSAKCIGRSSQAGSSSARSQRRTSSDAARVFENGGDAQLRGAETTTS